MPSKRIQSKPDFLKFFRGGNGIPEALAQKWFKGLQAKKSAQFQENAATQRQAAKYLSQLQGLKKPTIRNPETLKARDGLLSIHKRLPKQKSVAPKLAVGSNIAVTGLFSVTVSPPFDFAMAIPMVQVGVAPSLQSYANKGSGHLSGSVLTEQGPSNSGGSIYAAAGIYFRPIAPGYLTVSAAPVVSYSWYTSSPTMYEPVRSFGQVGLGVVGLDASGIQLNVQDTALIYDENQTGQFLTGQALEQQMDFRIIGLSVNPGCVYVLSVDVFAFAEGTGPSDGDTLLVPSYASSFIAATFASITYDFNMQPLVLA